MRPTLLALVTDNANGHTQAEQEDRLNTEGSDRLGHTLFINCGRALARAVDEQDLLRSVCNTLVNDCGFRLAWFGYTESDTSNSIRLVAQAGDQDGFLTSATLAIQPGETSWIKAIADSPLVAPIRAAALERGYTSVLSLPLKSDGTLFGALTIYADDPDKLDEPIVERLRQWSDFFALRVKTLRLHEEALKKYPPLEEQLRATLNVIPAYTWYADPSGALTFVNGRTADYLGLPKDHPLRSGIATGAAWDSHIPLLHPDDREGSRRAWSTCLGTGCAGEMIFRVRNADGGYRWSLSRAEPLRASDGSILHWIGVNLDIDDRERAQEDLRRNEYYLAEGQRLAHLGSWAFDAAGFDYWSPELFRMHGLEPASNAPTLQEYLDCVHPQDREFMAELIKRILAEPAPFDTTKRIVRPDGEVRYIRCVGTPVVENQALKRYVGSAIDVTEYELLTQELRRSEASLLDAQRLSRTGSWRHDISSGKVTNSPETIRMWGIQPGDDAEVTDFFFGRMHPDDRLSVEQAYQEAHVKKADFEAEFRIVLPDGTIKNIHSVGHPIVRESGDIVEFVGAAIDITERKQAERRLIVQHAVTQMLATAATLEEVTPKILQTVCGSLSWDVGTLWSVDREAGVLRCAEVWHDESVEVPQFAAVCRQHTFMPGVGVPGRVWSGREPAYIPDVAKDPNFPRGPIAARAGLHACFAFPILLGADVLGVIEFFSHEIRQPDQELLDLMATLGSQIGQFIERKRAEEAFRTAQTELAHVARVATLGEMTASIAHEINQPLGALVNNAGACLAWLDAKNLEGVRNSVELVMDDAQRATEIITRIRALVRKAPAQKDWLDMNQIMREVVGLAQSEVQRNHIALEMRLSDDVPLVLADRIQLQQVMLNLLMNAIEAMTQVTGPRELLISSEADGPKGVVVVVRDTGAGLDSKSLARLFEPFYTTKPQGMGMGLAICRSIIEAHSGRLWATTNPDRGASFHFSLPRGEKLE
jgi:PAS domain S-box-containing protein